MEISFERFMEIACERYASDILECWDRNTFEVYTEEFGPMTESEAYDLCNLTRAVTADELEAAKFFGDW